VIYGSVPRKCRFPAIVALVPVAILLLGSCADDETPGDVEFILETERSETLPASEDERIAEIEAEIQGYREAVAEHVRAYNGLARYEKLLANELIAQELYGPALEALERAMVIQTDNPVLYYLAAVTTAHRARAGVLGGDETEWLLRSEELYREAIELDPSYHDALYGLTVLLAFELDQPVEALETIRRLSEIETGDPKVRFLLANVLVRNGMYDEALSVYDDLARTAPSAEQRTRAEQNREALRSRPGGTE